MKKVLQYLRYTGPYNKSIPLNEQVLVGLFHIFTWYIWALFIVNFYSIGLVEIPGQLKSYYSLLLAAYVSIKEFGRWKFHVKRHRHGLFFLLMFAATGAIFWYLVAHNNIFHTKFILSPDFLWILTEITIFYAGTLVSKGIYSAVHKK